MLGGDDAQSVVSSTFFSEGDNNSDCDYDQANAHFEHEMKFDPNAVKTELIEEDERIHFSDEEDDFFSSRNDGGDLGDDEETPKLRRSRRKKITFKSASEFNPDPSDDINDDDWRDNRKSNKKKRVISKRAINRKLNKKKSDARERRKKRESKMTPEELEEQRKKWREEAKKKRELRKKQLEESEALEELVSEGESKTPEPRKKKPRPPGKRKKASEMTPEELEANREKWREEARRKRARMRSIKRELEGLDDYDDESKGDGDADSSSEPGNKRRSSGSIYLSNGKRKKVSEMTEEEKERERAKWREEARLKRQRQKEKMTPEQREEKLRKNREYVRMKRALERGTMTAEELQQRQESAQRDTLRRLERLANMTEDERRERKMRNYLSYRARLAQLTPEELEERKRKKREYYYQKKAKGFTEEEKQRMIDRVREYRKNMGPEKKEKWLKQLRESYKRRKERLKAEGKSEEIVKKWREAPKKRKLANGEEVPRRKIIPPNPNETPEEKKERIKAQQRIQSYKSRVRLRLKVKEMLDKGMSMEAINLEIETPEQREHRLMRIRVNKAKKKLRNQLVSCGASNDEIETQLQRFIATYTPSREFRPYKAMPNTWKPIEPEDINLINEDPPRPKRKPKSDSPSKSKSNKSKTDSGENSKPVEVEQVPSQDPLTPAEIEEKIDTLLQPPSAAPSTSSQMSHDSYQQHHPHQGPYSYNHSYNDYPSQSTSSAVPYRPLLFQNTGQHPYLNQMQMQPLSLQTSSLQTPQHIPDSYSSHNYSHNFDSSISESNYGDSTASYSYNNSPPHHADFDDHHDDYNDYSTQQQFDMPPPKQRRRRRRKNEEDGGGDPSLPRTKKGKLRKPHKIGTPYGSRNKNLTRARDSQCDDCGHYYTAHYLKEHKKMFHNPYFSEGKCLLCGESFKKTVFFWRHYKNVHYIPEKTVEKPVMCEECGQGFACETNLKSHRYYVHGPGQLMENRFKCEYCPDEKIFKQEITYRNHMRKFHLDKFTKYKCPQCELNFQTEPNLLEHMKETHPAHYFPCKYCRSVKFSQWTINFHYSKGCPKMPPGEHALVRKEIGSNSLENISIGCELCEKKVYLRNLTRHYWEMHGVREEKFQCTKCINVSDLKRNQFKRRDFYAAHLVDQHNMEPAQFLDDIRKLSASEEVREDIKRKIAEGIIERGPSRKKKKKERSEPKERPKKAERAPRKRKSRSKKAPVEEEEEKTKKKKKKDSLEESNEGGEKDKDGDGGNLSDLDINMIVKTELLSESDASMSEGEELMDQEGEEEQEDRGNSRPRRESNKRKSYKEARESEDDNEEEDS